MASNSFIVVICYCFLCPRHKGTKKIPHLQIYAGLSVNYLNFYRKLRCLSSLTMRNGILRSIITMNPITKYIVFHIIASDVDLPVDHTFSRL